MTPYYDNGLVKIYRADAREIPLLKPCLNRYWGVRTGEIRNRVITNANFV